MLPTTAATAQWQFGLWHSTNPGSDLRNCNSTIETSWNMLKPETSRNQNTIHLDHLGHLEMLVLDGKALSSRLQQGKAEPPARLKQQNPHGLNFSAFRIQDSQCRKKLMKHLQTISKRLPILTRSLSTFTQTAPIQWAATRMEASSDNSSNSK